MILTSDTLTLMCGGSPDLKNVASFCEGLNARGG